MPPNVTASLGTGQLKEMRAKRLGELKKALARENKLELQTKYFVLLPEQKAHENFHPIGAGALFTGKVHPKVIHKIHELVADGTTGVQEVNFRSNQMKQTELIFQPQQIFKIMCTLLRNYWNYQGLIKKI